jgi:hypothetical protein
VIVIFFKVHNFCYGWLLWLFTRATKNLSVPLPAILTCEEHLVVLLVQTTSSAGSNVLLLLAAEMYQFKCGRKHATVPYVFVICYERSCIRKAPAWKLPYMFPTCWNASTYNCVSLTNKTHWYNTSCWKCIASSSLSVLSLPSGTCCKLEAALEWGINKWQ